MEKWCVPWDRDGSLAKREKKEIRCIVLEWKKKKKKQNKEK